MKRTRLRKQSPEAKTWRELDALCRKLVVKVRDKNTCQRCGVTGDRKRLEWCHVVNRNAKSIQWTPWNSLALCGPRIASHSCHHWFDHRKEEALAWWADKFPKRALMLAAWRSSTPPKVDLQLQRQWLEREVARRRDSTP